MAHMLSLNEYDEYFHRVWGTPKGTVTAFDKESDWTIVLKLHAFLESTLNKRITDEIGKPALAPVIAKLNTSGMETGKIAFASALGILSEKDIDFVMRLSRLRNELVHNVDGFKFSFRDYWNNQKPSKLQGWYEALSPSVDLLKPEHLKKIMHDKDGNLKPSHPMVALIVRALHLARKIHVMGIGAVLRKQETTEAMELYRLTMASAKAAKPPK